MWMETIIRTEFLNVLDYSNQNYFQFNNIIYTNIDLSIIFACYNGTKRQLNIIEKFINAIQSKIKFIMK